MATTTKSKKSAKSTASSKVVSSKKKSLSKQQWTILGIIGVVVLATAGYFGYQAYENSTSSAASCVSNTYKKGSSGSCVKYIQILANYKFSGGSPKHSLLAADGVFGSGTKSGVEAFQKYWDLTSDGVVGKKTWASLCSAQMGYTDNKGVNHGVWGSQAALNAAKSAGCSVGNDVVR
jgi:peptidoglycan hydrolase-like protein with peptidoglycan-binding domain